MQWRVSRDILAHVRHPGRTHLTVPAVPSVPGPVVCWSLAVSPRPVLHRFCVYARSMTSRKGFRLSAVFAFTSSIPRLLLTPGLPGATERDRLLPATVSSQAPWSLCPLHFFRPSVPLGVPFTVPTFVPRSALPAPVHVAVRTVCRTWFLASSFASLPSVLALVGPTLAHRLGIAPLRRSSRSTRDLSGGCRSGAGVGPRCALLDLERHQDNELAIRDWGFRVHLGALRFVSWMDRSRHRPSPSSACAADDVQLTQSGDLDRALGR